jgi:hypothetical protein
VRCDLLVGEAFSDQTRDLQFLRGQAFGRCRVALARSFSGCAQLGLGAFGLWQRAEHPERFRCRPQVGSGLGAPPLAAEPLAVQQLCVGTPAR